MIATFINCLTILIGSVIGVKLGDRVKTEHNEVLFMGIGMISMVIGIRMCFEYTKTLYVVISITLGGYIGYLMNIDGAILKFGSFLEKRFSRKSSEKTGAFAHGFLNGSILFCIGAMTIVGSIQAGVAKEYDLLLTKSVMDGISSIIFAAGMGIGVAFSIITVLVIQGGLTLLAVFFGDFIPQLVISEISGLGGIMIIMIGINLLKLKDIKTANFLPALVLVALLAAIDPILPFSL